MKIIFMGTPDFSVPALESLLESSHEVIGVITQPDRPKGRSKEPKYPPVKEKALEYGIPVYQPAKVREEGFLEKIRALAPDAVVVIAFGQILPKAFLEIPKYGCFNIHASLLPKLRGAAPIQWAVMNGEEKSGVTIMQMDAGLDTGDMLLKKEIALEPKETGGSLHDKLMYLGGPLILDALSLAEKGLLKPEKQKEEESSYVKILDKALGKLDFNRPAKELERMIRGLNPWPSAYTFLGEKTLKIWDADVVKDRQEGENGEIIEIGRDYFLVQTKEGALSIKEVQLEGKKRMKTEAFLRGCTIETKMIL